jgi:predicted alpha/beta superfamily hydrolase
MKHSLSILIVLILNATAGKGQDNFSIGMRDSLHSKILNEDRHIWISVPRNPENPKQRYPVVYLLDGEWYFHSFTGITAHLDETNGNSMIPDMIIVGIINVDRGRDYTPTFDSSSNMRSGGGETFTQFLEKELIPYIDSKYPSVNHRTLVGHSFGGLFALNTLLKHNALFNSYIILDPALHFDHSRLLGESKTILKDRKFENKSLYLAIAHPINPDMDSTQAWKDTSNNSLGFRTIIELNHNLSANRSNGLRWKSRYFSNESHGTIPLIGSYEALRYIFDFYKRPVFAVLDNNSGSRLAAHYKKISRIMGYTILPPPTLVSGLSWRYRIDKRFDEGLRFLESIRVQYPEYAIVYQELGLMHQEKGDLTKAEEYYSKARELRAR